MGVAVVALNIRDRDVHELARRLADRTGETMTEAVKRALAERLERTTAAMPAEVEMRRRRIAEIVAEFRELPVLDDRGPDEIIGYNEQGHFD
jgi:antitoxin VapB